MNNQYLKKVEAHLFFSSTLLLLSLPQAFASENLDGEIIPVREEAQTAEIAQMIRVGVISEFKKTGHAFRGAHRKSHGCVQSQFQVLPGLRPELQVGIFSKPQTSPAWIRFSNGSGSSQDDNKGDGRGMAIKIMNTQGQLVLPQAHGASSQDFIMINHPVFFVRNVDDYTGFQKAASGGALKVLLWFLHPSHAFHEFAIARKIQGKEVKNPLATPYWSMTPSKFGSRQMKFSVSPCAVNSGSFVQASVSKDFLSENMREHLRTKTACFDFSVQLRTNPSTMPIEDPTIEWSEKESAYQRVAQIRIPVQTPVNTDFCENLTFTPWHSLVEHRPLGGISRARKSIYQEISKLRHDLNLQEEHEPSSF